MTVETPQSRTRGEHTSRSSVLTTHDLCAVLDVPFSEEQLAAITAPMDPQLVVAGAGSGKTTVMAARVTWLVATGAVRPDQVLGLTFTIKAAGELRARIAAALSTLGSAFIEESPTVSTYHSFASGLVADYGFLDGLESGALPLSDAQRAQLALQVVHRPQEPLQERYAQPATIVGNLLHLEDELTDLGISTDELRDADGRLLQTLQDLDSAPGLRGRVEAAARRRIELADLVDQFREEKQSRGLLDFADQTRLAAALVESHGIVRSDLRGRFRIVLLDEYQDTSKAQRELLRGLFGARHAITAVGDPAQAIYRWRGATVSNIDNFEDHFSLVSRNRLTTNRRSGTRILAVANRIAADLRRAHPGFHELVARTDADPGTVECALLTSYGEELAWLATKVGDLFGTGTDFGDVAILCRTNEQATDVAAALHEQQIPAQVLGKVPLTSHDAVASLHACLRLVAEPTPNDAVVQLLAGPYFRLGPSDLSALGSAAARTAAMTESHVDLLSTLDELPDGSLSEAARERVDELLDLVDRLTQAAARSLEAVIHSAVQALGFPLTLSGEAEASAVREFQNLAARYRGLTGARTVADFLAHLQAAEQLDAPVAVETQPRPGTVSVMTVHGSKGLEFPTVFVPFLSEGVFPSGTGQSRWVTHPAYAPPHLVGEPDPSLQTGFPHEVIDTASQREYTAVARAAERLDEDRLAYVALTRAKSHLVTSGHWWGPTQRRVRGPSPYLLAIHEQCLAHSWEEAVGPWVDTAPQRPVDQVDATGIEWPQPCVEPLSARVAALVDAATAPPTPSEELAAELRLLEPDPVTETPTRVSTTELLERLAGAEPAAPGPQRPRRAEQLGTRFHRLVEDRLHQHRLFDVTDDGRFIAGRDELLQVFETTEFADRTPVATEYPFTISLGGRAVVGRIDAVFASDDPDHDYDVVDWKTGRSRAHDPRQLSIYRRAWSLINGVAEDRIRVGFVHLDTGETRWIAEPPPAEPVSGSLER